jgi:hypothetical protein
MNSEERPALGWDRLIADQQHTVPAPPVKAHFALFRREGIYRAGENIEMSEDSERTINNFR